MPRLLPSLLAFTALLATAAGGARTLTFHSSTSPTSLIELYTSEGCSSCPPADEWLGRLVSDPGLWTTFVPVAFHVSYWDRLGWRDPFAQKEFAGRQYAYTAVWEKSSVYTPCFVRDGAEWRPGRLPIHPNNAKTPGELEITWRDNGECDLRFTPTASTSETAYTANVALLGNGLGSVIRAGENSGRTLRHDFVVLDLRQIEMTRDSGGAFSARVTVGMEKATRLKRLSIAAWINRPRDLAPVQATGGWIDRGN